MLNQIEQETEKNISILSINRPEALNALNKVILDELNRKIDEISTDPNIRVLIITGKGRSFVAGADIESQSKLDVEGGLKWGRYGSSIFRKIENLSIPTIAAVNGFALGGGCELALSCDIIIANKKAKFGQPEVGLGITPGFSGTQRLPRRVGIGMAKEMIFTGKVIDADRAMQIGLVNKVTEADHLIEEAKSMARIISKNAPLAVSYSKKAIDSGVDTSLDIGIKIENELFSMCFGTEDQKEGMRAFLDKEEVSYKGK